MTVAKFSRTTLSKKFVFLASIVFPLCLTGCFSTDYPYQYGLQDPIDSYASARIAVLNCKQWPNSATIENSGRLNTGPTISNQLCRIFDIELLKSFKGQPFVKGKSPRSIKKLITNSESPELLENLFSEWDTPDNCEVCNDPVQYYKYYLAEKLEWIRYINSFSTATDYSDAVLLPLVTEASEEQVNDTGIVRAKRKAKVVVFLIDTDSGKLKWAGTRTASASNSVFGNEIGDKKIVYPDWDIVYQRLFSNILWIDFPGRQEK